MRVKHKITGQNMPGVPQNEFDRGSVERLFLEQKFAEAATVLSEFISKDPPNRETSLYLLLAKVQLDGAEPHEQKIDSLRRLYDLDDKEKQLVRRIFLLGFQAAEKADNQEKTWAYQRLLRRLILGQPLDQPIPVTQKQVPAPRQEIPVPLTVSLPGAVQGQLAEAEKRIPTAGILPARKNVTRDLALALGVVVLLATPMAYVVSGKHRARAYQTTARSESLPRITAGTKVTTLGLGASESNPASAILSATNEGQLRALVAKQLTSLRRAYGRRIAKNRTLRGNLLLKLTVDPSGKVVRVDEIEADLTDNKFARVVIAEARKWRFPKSDSEAAKLIVPLVFVPNNTNPTTIARWAQKSQSVARTIPLPHTAEPSIAAKSRVTNERSPRAAKTKEYAKFAHPPAVQSAAAAKPLPEFRTSRTLPMREEPRFASAPLQQIDAGTPISVLEIDGDWIKIKAEPFGITGYVRKEYLASPTIPRQRSLSGSR
jgi:hypothetical protein